MKVRAKLAKRGYEAVPDTNTTATTCTHVCQIRMTAEFSTNGNAMNIDGYAMYVDDNANVNSMNIDATDNPQM
jgi:transcription elongation factor Elf1